MTGPKKNLVLGAAVSGRDIESYRWNELPQGLNPADFERVVLCLASAPMREQVPNIPPDQVLFRMFANPKSEVIVIGSPRGNLYGTSPLCPVWSPYQPRFIEAESRRIENVDERLRPYFKLVDRTSWHIETNQVGVHAGYKDVLHPGGGGALTATVTPIATNLAGESIAMHLRMQSRGLVDTHTHVTWLPSPTRGDIEEAVLVALKSLFGISNTLEPPSWLSDYPLPTHEPIRAKIDALQADAERIAADLRQAEADLENASRFSKLLCETGDELRDIVLDALAELGAEVENLPDLHKEDGRFKDPYDRNAIVEVKGVTGSPKRKDVRQLHDWVSDADDDWVGRGVLIVNPRLSIPPTAREDVFPDDCVKAADRYGYCIVNTMQLYHALQRQQGGDFDRREFWDAIMSCEGACALPGLA